jgi:hypothetical protein
VLDSPQIGVDVRCRAEAVVVGALFSAGSTSLEATE